MSKDISKTYHTLHEYSMLLELARKIILIVDPQPVYSQTLRRKEGSTLDTIFGYDRSMLWDLLFLLCIDIPIAGVAQLAARISAIAPYQGKRHTDLQALVDLLVQAPGSGTNMKIIVYLEHMHLEDLAIVLGLLNLRRGPTTFEEVWTSWLPHGMDLEHMKEKYEKHYRNLVVSAAEQAGCIEILNIPPELDVDETDEGDIRGTQYIMRSRRTWTENNII
ncbi:uncharacterized protein BHQ10_003222 [Talaromyces amestolkiae]|uniref:Uncharacterized protein n=1 Tax=Talaromyces amestolkiae TaxID=1196081 RepID=A0A364KUH4_TALAM|nr:uncharacterized protein BHQ10_003222 [Talaromyces amestolkiae]RAO67210.1 hypothetical protein BHQ10_003222 [Talaromyces amestolkiae]